MHTKDNMLKARLSIVNKRKAVDPTRKVIIYRQLLKDIVSLKRSLGKKNVEEKIMDLKEKVKNNVLLKMQYHLDSNTMNILDRVLLQELSGVEIVEMQTLPATVDDSNDYIIQLFRLQKAPKLSVKTVNFYLDTIRRLIDTTHKPLLKMTSMDIEMFLLSIRQDNTEVSMNNQRRNISAFYTWMRKSHLILENPCEAIDPYKEIEKPIDHMEPEEGEQLKYGCKYKRDRALMEFLRSTAVRVGEAAGVKISDIDWIKGEVTIYGEKTRSYRIQGIDTVAMRYIADYIQERGLPQSSHEPLFVGVKGDKKQPLSTSGIRGAVSSIKRRAELERRVYPHLFRKTTATNIVKRGGSVHDAGEYLGHKERSTAGRHYTCLDNGHRQDIFRKFVATV